MLARFHLMHGVIHRNAASLGPNSGIVSPVALVDAGRDAMLDCKIFIVDDEEPNVRLLERILTRAGYDNFISTTESREAASLFADFQPDLILTDWLMPEFDGCDVIAQIRALTATDDYLPIVVLTADITQQTRQRALAAGATDFLTKPFDQIEVLLRIQNLLRARLSHLTVLAHNATLEQSVRLRTFELESTLTELRQTQQQVIRQERLAALGTMAGGIAHDFNNALSVIMGFGESLLHNAEHGLTKENSVPAITTILTAAEDAAAIVRRLQAFYRPEDAEERRIPVDLNELIEQAVALTRPRWETEAIASGRTIGVTMEPGERSHVSGDPTELREVLTNLIFNAVDALPHGGTITLGTHLEGGIATLTVRDTGIGMSEDARQHCLEPFFTTKGSRGTGLGLSMVFGVIQRHKGKIEVESQLGKGSAFTVRLPAVGTESLAVAAVSARVNAALHVLVVDDQPILCQLTCQYLRDDLHTVETAFSGHDALKKFHADDFDLVITDHVMAAMTGEQLAVAIKKSHVKMPVILLTGFLGESTSEDRLPDGVDLVVGKPLSRAALRHAVSVAMEIDFASSPVSQAPLC